MHEEKIYDIVYDNFDHKQLGNNIDVNLKPLIDDLNYCRKKTSIRLIHMINKVSVCHTIFRCISLTC